MREHVETLLRRAAQSEDSQEALNFSQAAVNAANVAVYMDLNTKQNVHSAPETPRVN